MQASHYVSRILQWVVYVVLAWECATAGMTSYVRHPDTFAGGGPPFDSWGNAATNIQQAINHTDAGGLVVVSNGTYSEGAVISVTNGITLQGVNGKDVTKIDGGGNWRCLDVNAGFAEGVTVQNGRAASAGGGAKVVNGIMRDCIIMHNYGEGLGAAGVSLADSVLSNCIVRGNTNFNSATSRAGGGVSMNNSTVWLCDICDNISTGISATYAVGGGMIIDGGTENFVVSCIISNNLARGAGGGIFGLYNTVISNTIIAGNRHSSGSGGGVCASGSAHLFFDGCTISNNYSPISGGGIYCPSAARITVNNCELFDNISGSSASVSYGGGVYLVGGAGSLITNCLFRGNQTARKGGAIMLHGDNIVTHCHIENNILLHTATGAADGAGIYAQPVEDSQAETRTPKIIACVVSNNGAPYARYPKGGGIYAERKVEIRQCLVVNNYVTNSTADAAKYGGGIYVGSNCLVESCTIASNAARDGGGLYLNGNGNQVLNTIMYHNIADTADAGDIYTAGAGSDLQYNCASKSLAGAGNITGEPKFAGRAEGNYRLTRESPCANAGLNQDWMRAAGAGDLEGQPRIDRFSGRVDIGCYEYLFGGTLFGIR